MDPQKLDWEELLDLVNAGCVVPVVGNELYSWPDDAAGTLEDDVLQQVSQRLPWRGERPRNIKDFANQFLRDNPTSHDRLRFSLRQAFKSASRVPPAVDQLARIDDFRLYISATPSTILADAVARVRLRGTGVCSQTHFVPKSQIRPEPLPGADIPRLSVPHVFYPFGCTAATSFAITEEETLDYLCQLFADPQLRDLLTAINQCHLLFIGCNFPDWLTRFWIRALAGERVWNRMRDKFEYIVDQRTCEDPPLVMFLDRVAVRVSSMKASAFVGELYARWSGRTESSSVDHSRAALPTRPDDPYIFLSYASEDKERAATLDRRLGDAGLTTWFDARHMRAGDNIQLALRDRIEKCALFMPILSKHVRLRGEGWFRQEWSYAETRTSRIRKGDHFIIPVIVDDLPERDAGVGAPEVFWDVKCERIIDGAATSDFCKYVKHLIRKAQK